MKIQFKRAKKSSSSTTPNAPTNMQKSNMDNNPKKAKTEKKSYATVIQNATKSIIIKTKTDEVNIANIKQDMSSQVDPTAFNVSNVKQMGKNAIVIQCNDEQEIEKLKTEVATKLGDKYEVQSAELKNSQLKIVGMTNIITEAELITNLKKQNDHLKEAQELKVIKIFENKNRKPETYCAIIEVQYDTFAKIMATQKVNIAGDRCKVYEYVNLRRCYKCLGYNHIASNCTKNKLCPKCGN